MFATILFLVTVCFYFHLWSEYEARHSAPPQAEPAPVEGHEEPAAEPAAIPAQAAAIAAPVTTTTVRTEPAPMADEIPTKREFIEGMTVAQLRRLCSETGVRWRDRHGKNRHMRRAEMIDAILA